METFSSRLPKSCYSWKKQILRTPCIITSPITRVIVCAYFSAHSAVSYILSEFCITLNNALHNPLYVPNIFSDCNNISWSKSRRGAAVFVPPHHCPWGPQDGIFNVRPFHLPSNARIRIVDNALALITRLKHFRYDEICMRPVRFISPTAFLTCPPPQIIQKKKSNPVIPFAILLFSPCA